MQNRIFSPIPLLDKKGNIIKEGWASQPYWNYDRNLIAAPDWRIKEWDYYAILNEEQGYGIALTISDLGYMGFISLTFLDFKNNFFNSVDQMLLFPMGKLRLSPSSDNGKVEFKNKKLSLVFQTNKNNGFIERTLSFESDFLVNKEGEKGIKGQIILKNQKESDSIFIATSWKENRKAFYYNQKTNCLKASGSFTIGKQAYHFNPEKDLGVIDWGRGNWTYKNRWYWSSLSSYLEGKTFGWNLGYGFSDRTPASENAVFYEGKVHKLDIVEFIINKNDYMAPWEMKDNEGRLNLRFTPILDRKSSTDLKIIKSIQHQVFGYFNGFIILDNGEKIEVPNKLGFAEDVLNYW